MAEKEKKVLILANTISGLYNVRKELISALQESGFLVYIGAPKGVRADYFEEQGCFLKYIEYNRKGTNPFYDIILLRKYLIVIREVLPSIVLTFAIKPNVYGGIACRINNVPQIANITGLGVALEMPGFLQKVGIHLYRFGLKQTKTVFMQNEANKSFFVEHNIYKGHYRLIPGSGVNLDFHRLLDYPDDSSISFVFISRIMKAKGIDQYLEAAEYCKKKYPQCYFHVIGGCEDNYLQRLKDLDHKKIIIYHGGLFDVRPILHQCHCLIHPSYYAEGMSNVLQEACAAGRPVITTDRPGCGEIVVDGVTGYVVKQKDTQDLIKKIENFISLPYNVKREMGLAARKKVEKEFDRQIVIEAYLDEISKID